MSRFTRWATAMCLVGVAASAALTGCGTVTVHPAVAGPTAAVTAAGTTGQSDPARPAPRAANGGSTATPTTTRPTGGPWRQALLDAGLDEVVDTTSPKLSVVENDTFVVAGEVPRDELDEILQTATRYDTAIAAFSGSRPRGPLVILLSRDADQFADWTGGGDAENYDGVTVPSTAYERQYVTLGPDVWDNGVEADYRSYLLVHELVHAYTDPRDDVNGWPVEGFAELGAMDLTDQEWRGDPPTSAHLPTDAEFRSADPQKMSDAYFLASDLMDYLEQKYGRSAVRTFYTKVLHTNVEDACQQAFGKRLSVVVADWKAGYADTWW